MDKTKVVLQKCNSYDINALIEIFEYSFKKLGGIKNIIKHSDNILLKPNMLSGFTPDRAVTTHPDFIEALIIFLKKHQYNKLYLGDSPGHGKSTSDIVSVCGYRQICKKHDVKVIDLVTKKEIYNPYAKKYRKFIIAKEIEKFDVIINLAKLKTHILTMMTGAVKNLYGLVPLKVKQDYHLKASNQSDFSQLLIDLHDTLTQKSKIIHLMDGIIGMEGNGPAGGRPKKIGAVLLSNSAFALDTVVEQIMKLENSPVNEEAKKRKIEGAYIRNIDIEGDCLKKFENIKIKLPFNISKYVPDFLLKLSKNILLQYPVAIRAKCISCKKCYDMCPAGAIVMKSVKYNQSNKKIPVFNYSKCIRCYCCQEICPAKAINLKKPLLMKLISRKR